jgi:O-antigen/teichoic acid export membrane protein
VKTFSAYVSEGVRGWPRPHAAFGVSLVAYKTAADAVSKVVTLTVTVAAARTLPPADFGVMALAMTTGWLIGVATDAGLPMYAATRVAQAHRAGLGAYGIAHEVMRWRLRLALAGSGAAAALAVLLVPRGARLAFLLIVLHQLLGAMLETVAHVYRGLGRTDIESTVALAHRGAIALAALTVLAVWPSLTALSIALAVPPLLALVVSPAILQRVTHRGQQPFTLTAHTLLSHVAPLGLGVLLSALYFRIDVYFLERLHGVEVVGLYNAAFRIVDALRLFPAAGLAVVYPVLCAATDFKTLRRLLVMLTIAASAVAAALYAAAGPMLELVYGRPFTAATDALRVLSFAIPLFFVNYALTHQVIAWDRQRAYLAVAAAALIANLVCNTLLIPEWQMVGAAYSTLITELVVTAGCVVALRTR